MRLQLSERERLEREPGIAQAVLMFGRAMHAAN